MDNNVQEKILVTYFDKFGGRKNNFSKLVGEFLSQQLHCDSIMLKVSGFSIDSNSKNILMDMLRSNTYDRVISLGEYKSKKYDIRFEHIKDKEQSANNFIVNIKNISFLKIQLHTSNYFNRYLGACYYLRNILCDNTFEFEYDWEFIHINRNVESIFKIVNYISNIART